MSYWDVDNFLTQQQKITCTFRQDSPKMDFVDPSKGIIGDVPAQLPLHIPIWLASTLQSYLFENEEELVNVQIPTYLRRDQLDDYFNAVENDRRAKLQDINLRDKSTYFYHVYYNICKILIDTPNLMDQERIKSVISSRGLSIIDRASTIPQEQKAQSRFRNYTENERQLFKNVRKRCKQYENWECNNSKKE